MKLVFQMNSFISFSVPPHSFSCIHNYKLGFCYIYYIVSFLDFSVVYNLIGSLLCCVLSYQNVCAKRKRKKDTKKIIITLPKSCPKYNILWRILWKIVKMCLTRLLLYLSRLQKRQKKGKIMWIQFINAHQKFCTFFYLAVFVRWLYTHDGEIHTHKTTDKSNYINSFFFMNFCLFFFPNFWLKIVCFLILMCLPTFFFSWHTFEKKNLFLCLVLLLPPIKRWNYNLMNVNSLCPSDENIKTDEL